MNKRINELAKQCETLSGYGDQYKVDFDREKFAQLIILETLGVVCEVRTTARAEFEISNRTDLDKFIANGSSANMVNAVNEHFGIK